MFHIRRIQPNISLQLQTRNFAAITKLVQPTLSINDRQLFINNRFVDSLSGKTLNVIDPRNDNVITSVSEGFEEDIHLAIDASHEAFYNGPWYNEYTPSQRGRILNKWADLIEQHMEELAIIESWDVGQPLQFARRFLDRGVKSIRYYAGYADKANGATLSPDAPNFIATTYREPVGIMGTILPWNAPALMFVNQCGAALAFGNTIVVKPAETSPLSALYLARLAAEAGIPDGVLNVVTGYGETAGQALCSNNKIGKLSFTGESATGKAVMRTASENLIPVSLELGGKSPMIIFPDANMDIAVNLSQMGVFTNSGQICCASTRIFVHETVYDEFVEKTVEKTKERKVGDNLNSDLNVDQGPQQNKQQFEKVLNYLDIGKNEGADVLVGGNKCEGMSDNGYFVESTVFGNVKDEMDIAKNEIFGPCMQLLIYDDNVKEYDIDNVINRANNTRFGLAAGIITNDTNIINKCRKQMQAGTIYVNCWNSNFPQTPFGGYKESGFGRIGGPYCVDNFTKVKVATQMLL
eukprot:386384_1